ncbi:unnamed protein product [Discosporangium mesarthrocarpum]
MITNPSTLSMITCSHMAESKAPSKSGTATLVVLFILWYGFNAFYNVSNKFVLRTWAFPYMTSFLQTVIGLIYVIPLWVLGVQPAPKLTTNEALKLMPIATLHALGHLAAVVSMGAGAVSFTHIIKASEPVASTVISPLFGVKVQPMSVNIWLLPIVGGVAYAAMKPGQGFDVSELMGFASACAMVSNVFFAIRGILSKKVMTPEYKEKKNMDASNTYAVLTILSSFILLVPAIFMEGSSAFESYNKIEDKTTLVQTLFGCGMTYYLYNEMGFRVLGKLDAVATAVGNTVKRVVIMAAAVAFLGEKMTPNKLIGALVAVSGTMAYSLAKNAAAKKVKTV